MPEQIIYQGVEGQRFGRFKGRINTTCIVYRIGSLVIDTGPANQWRAVRRFLEEKAVKQVLLTHHHEDHSGNASTIQSHFQAQVLGHPQSANLIKARHFLPYQKVIWGIPPTFQVQALPPQVKTGALTIKPIACPGHAEDMICYLAPERGWLFSGDLYIAKQTRYARLDENPGQEIQTLKQILNLDFEVVFCAHRGVIPAGKAALTAKLQFLEYIYQESRQRFQKGQSIAEITQILLGEESWLHWLTSGDFSKTHFIQACLRDLLVKPS